jgi:lysophospholipase L1-like esterase
LVKNIAKKYQFPVYDFSNDSLFYNNTLFAGDGTHLNDKGARLFTNQVIDSIMNDQAVSISKGTLVKKQK